MNKTISLLALTLFLALPGCGSAVDPAEPASQQYLFEGSILNRAWGYDHSGFSIDAAGNVYSFRWESQGATWTPKENDEYTAAELAAQYAPNRKFIRTIPHDSLEAMKSLMAPALAGKATDTFDLGVDQGVTDMILYRYDADRKVYSRVVLGRTGDLNFVNQSAAAKTIVGWLQGIKAEIGK